MNKTKLEKYLNSINDKYVDISLLDNYEEYGYDSYNDFKLVIEFLFQNFYKLCIIEKGKKRLGQDEYRNIIKEKYKRCIITNSIVEECDAVHIVEHHNGGSYDIDNGLLLNSAIHKTFDKNYWTIHPDTMNIIVKENHRGSIKKYEGTKVDIIMTPKLYKNLTTRYKLFIQY